MPHANIAIFVPHAGCPHQCIFCDQRGISGAQSIPGSGEVAAVLAKAAKSLGESTRSGEIAFFGGSFTAIPRREMLRLLGAAQPFLGPGGFAGIRISTRPDAVGDEVLGLLAQYGVTAIELGAQSMDDAVLAASSRGHTAAAVADACRRIQAHGFSLGLQMMTGLPGDSDRGAVATAQAFAALQPDTVRIYPTLVLRNTPLADLYEAGGYVPQSLDAAVSLCAGLLELFYRQALSALENIPPGRVTLSVARGSASKMAGQKRANLLELAGRGYQAKIYERADIDYLAVQAERS